MEESVVQFFENDQFKVHTRIDKNGNVWLNIADTARGLGWIMTRKERVTKVCDNPEESCDKFYTAIRWNLVNKYIAEIQSRAQSELIQAVTLPVKKSDYIPENLFYRLAMKANNELAEKFQAWVADEVLPALRKDGYYVSQKFSADSVNIDSSTELSATASTIPAEKKIELLLEFAKLTTLGKLRNQFLREAALLLTGKKF